MSELANGGPTRTGSRPTARQHTVLGEPTRPAEEESTGRLVQQATDQVSRLIRDEFALAKIELAEKGRQAGKGAGFLGGGALIALYGGGALVATLILLLAEAMPAWVAALIVTVVLFAIAGIAALMGRNRVQEAMPPMSDERSRSVREDVDAVTSGVRHRGEHEAGTAPRERP